MSIKERLRAVIDSQDISIKTFIELVDTPIGLFITISAESLSLVQNF